jgi:iron complex outermembrane receptor protein
VNTGYRKSWDETFHHEERVLDGVVTSSQDTVKEREGRPDPKYGWEYDLADNIMLYGSYSSSYRMGGYMQVSRNGGEQLKSYTAGTKTRWFGNKLQVNASAFYYDYTNRVLKSASAQNETIDLNELEWGIDFNEDGVIQDLDVAVDSEGSRQNTGDFESLGVDVQTNWIITSKDRLNLSVSWLEAVWYDLVLEYSYPDVWPTENFDGVTNIKSPEWSVSGGYTHNFNLWEYGVLNTGIQMQYKSHFTLLWHPDDDPDGYGYQEPYFTFNGNASFNHSSGRWSITANVKNITNYAVKSSFSGAGGQANSAQFKMRISEPRSYSAVFSIKF